MKTGERIKEIRKSKKITQKEMSSILNINIRTYQKYESDEITLNMDMLKKIAIALDISLISLIDDPSEIIDKKGVFIGSLHENNKKDEKDKELAKLICEKYENLEMFNKLFKSAIFEERYDYKFEELGSKYIAELYNFMDEMIKLKINEIKYKKNSK